MSGEDDSEMWYSDEDDAGYEDYYNITDDVYLRETFDDIDVDPEYFEYQCLLVDQVDQLLDESIQSLSSRLQVILQLKSCSFKVLLV